MEKQIIFEACYNEMTYESSFMTISLHRTKKGAEKAIRKSKRQVKKDFYSFYNDENKPLEWNEFKAWGIFESELLE